MFHHGFQRRQLSGRRVHSTAGDERETAPVVPHTDRVRLVCRWLRLRQQLLPHPEACIRQQRRDRIVRRPRQRAGMVMRHLLGQSPRRVDRHCPSSFERRRRPEEVQVVRVVADGIQPLRLTLGKIVLVSGDRPHVGFRGIGVASDADVDVRGHMDHVSCGWHQRAETIGARCCPVGIGRSLEQVNVVVQCTCVVRLSRNDGFEHGEDARRLGLGSAVLLPVVPRHRVHLRIREECLNVRIIFKTVGGLLHRSGVGAVEGGAIAFAVSGVSQRQRLDECLLAGGRATGQCARLPDGGVGLPTVFLRHRRIEVGTKRDRPSPVRHRKTGIQPRRFAKRANRLGVVERIQQAQPLIEEALRLGHRGRDRHVQCPQPGELWGNRYAFLCTG